MNACAARAAAAGRLAYKSCADSEYEYDPATATLWGYMRQEGVPCFTLGLLKEIRSVGAEIAASRGHLELEGAMQPVHYYVAASRTPRVYSLGGDLALFLLLIRARDRDALAHYARLCIDNVHEQLQHYRVPTLTTIALVQGEALGGGFEMALSADLLVAEESATLGLPEVLFNLFPGMGAYSLLARRAGRRIAEDVILSGRVLPARRLHELGIVDIVAPDGEGERTVAEWIARNRRRANAFCGVMRARSQVFPVTREELDAVVDTWVECALRLEERDLQMIARLVRAQQAQFGLAARPPRPMLARAD